MWLAASQETLHRLIDERERSADEAAARDFDADPLDDAVDPALRIYAKVRRRDRRATWGQAVDEMVGKAIPLRNDASTAPNLRPNRRQIRLDS
jgi:hypothetical protein